MEQIPGIILSKMKMCREAPLDAQLVSAILAESLLNNNLGCDLHRSGARREEHGVQCSETNG